MEKHRDTVVFSAMMHDQMFSLDFFILKEQRIDSELMLIAALHNLQRFWAYVFGPELINCLAPLIAKLGIMGPNQDVRILRHALEIFFQDWYCTVSTYHTPLLVYDFGVWSSGTPNAKPGLGDLLSKWIRDFSVDEKLVYEYTRPNGTLDRITGSRVPWQGTAGRLVPSVSNPLPGSGLSTTVAGDSMSKRQKKKKRKAGSTGGSGGSSGGGGAAGGSGSHSSTSHSASNPAPRKICVTYALHKLGIYPNGCTRPHCSFLHLSDTEFLPSYDAISGASLWNRLSNQPSLANHPAVVETLRRLLKQ